MKDPQLRRLLTHMNRGPAWRSRSEVGAWLGRRAGPVIAHAVESGALVQIKIGRKLYLGALWRARTGAPLV